MECAELLQQLLNCTVLRCAHGANSGELMVNPFSFCIPLPQLDFQYGPRFVSFSVVVRLTTNYVTTGLGGKNQIDHWVRIRHFTDNPF